MKRRTRLRLPLRRPRSTRFCKRPHAPGVRQDLARQTRGALAGRGSETGSAFGFSADATTGLRLQDSNQQIVRSRPTIPPASARYSPASACAATAVRSASFGHVGDGGPPRKFPLGIGPDPSLDSGPSSYAHRLALRRKQTFEKFADDLRLVGFTCTIWSKAPSIAGWPVRSNSTTPSQLR